MAKRRRPTEDDVVRFAFFLACEGLVTPPPDAPPRMFPPQICTRAEIFKSLRHEFGHRAAEWAKTMRLFTEH